jgi:hypothetical protein
MTTPTMTALWRVVAALTALAACGGSDEAPLFPADHAASYVEVRGCRPSGDHDLNHVRVLADPAAADAYRLRDRAFPVGAVVLKAEYEFSDDTCTGPVQLWTVMVRLAAGSAPTTLDWRWQKVDADRNVVSDDEPRCYGCHTACGVAPDGYQGTCAVP